MRQSRPIPSCPNTFPKFEHRRRGSSRLRLRKLTVKEKTNAVDQRTMLEVQVGWSSRA